MEFRRSLAASFLFRFFVDVALRLRAEAPGAGGWLPPAHESAAARFERPPARGIQYFSKAGDADVVGQPERHLAADLQVPHQAPHIFSGHLPFFVMRHCGSDFWGHAGHSKHKMQRLQGGPAAKGSTQRERERLAVFMVVQLQASLLHYDTL